MSIPHLIVKEGKQKEGRKIRNSTRYKDGKQKQEEKDVVSTIASLDLQDSISLLYTTAATEWTIAI